MTHLVVGFGVPFLLIIGGLVVVWRSNFIRADSHRPLRHKRVNLKFLPRSYR